MDVRAADDILIDYDFERDGYRIQMATVHEWDSVEDMQATGEGLVEVAFAPSWAPGSEKNPLAKKDPEPADGADRAAYEAAMAFQWSGSPFLPNSSAAIPWNDIGEESQRFWLKIAQAAVRKAAEDAGGELT